MMIELTRFLDHRGSRRAFVGSLTALSLSTVGLGSAAAARGAGASAIQPAMHAPYLFTHITLRPGTLNAFTEVLGELAHLLAKHAGWTLQGCYLQDDGAAQTVIDVWEIPSADAVQTGLAAAAEDPAFGSLLPRIQACVESETLQVMTRQPVTIG